VLKKRKSGILLHVTSLPSAFGIGDLGPGARRFVDFLESSCQHVWQILPLNPTEVCYGNSPYSSTSAFAGNPLLMSPAQFLEERLVSKEDVVKTSDFKARGVDYRRVTKYKQGLLSSAVNNCLKMGHPAWKFDQFCEENAFWIDDYVLFEALKELFRGEVWSRWPEEIRERRPDELESVKRGLRERVEEKKRAQYLFFRQWKRLKEYANRKNIQIFGDLPIYVNYDSADVWAHQELFKLDKNGAPVALSGVPPDYFSSTGQLWGNPIYRWDKMKERGFRWWVERIAHNLKLFDLIRIDHFRGFEDFWEVPAGESTAVNGRWVQGPREDFFTLLLDRFSCPPIVAEDLGQITQEVHALRDRFQFPGMRVLQFGFSDAKNSEYHRPHNYVENCVAYTGTHDNNTIIGWLREDHSSHRNSKKETREEKKRALAYVGARSSRSQDVHWDFIRALMMSSARLVIVPMQDYLGLGSKGRMNYPSVPDGNWEWRLQEEELTPVLSERISACTCLYGRCG
jgi:4-alpha-glucanotransferase